MTHWDRSDHRDYYNHLRVFLVPPRSSTALHHIFLVSIWCWLLVVVPADADTFNFKSVSCRVVAEPAFSSGLTDAQHPCSNARTVVVFGSRAAETVTTLQTKTECSRARFRVCRSTRNRVVFAMRNDSSLSTHASCALISKNPPNNLDIARGDARCERL